MESISHHLSLGSKKESMVSVADMGGKRSQSGLFWRKHPKVCYVYSNG